ncbi:MAG: Ig-like domain-containing protein [Muribaculaceae bacterium]|nr:Ig-like domain-containing protein [Muribaculaceae bacterium]
MKRIFTLVLSGVLLCMGNAKAEDPEYVDMGTSVLWATQPLGVDADNPYGSLYTFGAPKPYPGVSYYALNRFDVDEWGGNPECDAATAAYGKGYSTPSKAQFEELFKVCDYTSTFDHTLGRKVITLTSKVTGNKIEIYGAGYNSFMNDHTSSGDLYLFTSSGEANTDVTGYYFSSTAAFYQGLENSILKTEYATSYAYQILPVFNADDVVKASGIKLNASEMKLTVDETVVLTATVEPADVSNGAVVWSSSDESVATVSAEGEVRGIAPGECTITATTADGTDLSAQCTLTVIQKTAGMRSVDLGLSVLWGDCEIGASDYTEAGTYYAWGTVDNANNYTGAVGSAYLPENFTEDCTGVLRDPSDPTKAYDVAREVLGEGWHTPSRAEWDELIANCTMTSERVNGTVHYCIKSKLNGNSIYFTGHGYVRETSASPSMSTSVILQNSSAVGENGIYPAIYFASPNIRTMDRYCFWLIPIRPVYKVSDSAIDSVVTDGASADGKFDVYNIMGQRLLQSVDYSDACGRLRSGAIYIFVGADGHRLKVAL